jgi:hypothetical protein
MAAGLPGGSGTSCAGIRWLKMFSGGAYMCHDKANNQPFNHSTSSRFSSQSCSRSTTQTIFFIVLIFSALIVSAQYAQGASVTLMWNPNSPAENVIGYRLYYGTESRNYAFMIDITDETSKKISHLEKGQNYYFAVTAFNGAGEESDFSDEIAVNTCTYKLFLKRRVFKATGGVKKIRVRTQPECEWTAQSEESWVRIIEGEDVSTGSGFVTYSVDPNPDPEKRITVLRLGGKPFKIIQRGSTLQE